MVIRPSPSRSGKAARSIGPEARLISMNPATGETLFTFSAHTPAEIDKKLEQAHEAFRSWRGTSLPERASPLIRLASLLASEKEVLAHLMTSEMGKTLVAARQEVEKCEWACRFYAEKGERFLADELVETSARKSFVRYQPLGVVLAIMPWNFPFWQVFRFAAPALLAGNGVVLKHASNVPQCALALEDLFSRAGFPSAVFQTLLLPSERVAEVAPEIIADPRIAAVTITGSVRAGSEVATHAGRNLKKIVLELGGSDPFIVLPSADLKQAVSAAVRARILNNGQSCVAAKRFIVHESIADEFERGFVELLDQLTVGDPMAEATDLGPLASAEALFRLEQQVQTSIEMGARVLTGGQRFLRPGNYYMPTALSEIPLESPAYTEELFGPVACIFRARNLEDAIQLANDTDFGLGASAWTRSEAEQALLIEGIEAGTVFINAMVASDPRLPFGGIKKSGFGRELGVQGIREFTNAKTIWIGDGAPSAGKTE